MDLISRQAAIEALEEPCKVPDTWTDEYAVGERTQWEKDVKALNSLPSAEPEIIRCKDCRWWDRKAENSPIGYCHACKHGYYSGHWEIHIIRTYKEDFFCADAERKEEEQDE